MLVTEVYRCAGGGRSDGALHRSARPVSVPPSTPEPRQQMRSLFRLALAGLHQEDFRGARVMLCRASPAWVLFLGGDLRQGGAGPPRMIIGCGGKAVGCCGRWRACCSLPGSARTHLHCIQADACRGARATSTSNEIGAAPHGSRLFASPGRSGSALAACGAWRLGSGASGAAPLPCAPGKMNLLFHACSPVTADFIRSPKIISGQT